MRKKVSKRNSKRRSRRKVSKRNSKRLSQQKYNKKQSGGIDVFGKECHLFAGNNAAENFDACVAKSSLEQLKNLKAKSSEQLKNLKAKSSLEQLKNLKRVVFDKRIQLAVGKDETKLFLLEKQYLKKKRNSGHKKKIDQYWNKFVNNDDEEKLIITLIEELYDVSGSSFKTAWENENYLQAANLLRDALKIKMAPYGVGSPGEDGFVNVGDLDNDNDIKKNIKARKYKKLFDDLTQEEKKKSSEDGFVTILKKVNITPPQQ